MTYTYADHLIKSIKMGLSAEEYKERKKDYDELKQKFLAGEISVDGTNVTNTSMLEFACTLGDLHEVKWLVEDQHASITFNAIYRALYRDNTDVVDFLSTLKPLFTPDASGNTFFHHMAEVDEGRKILLELIARGADVNARNRRGETALFHAVLAGQAESIQTLAENGADITIPNFNGETIYHAQQHSHVDLSFLDTHPEAAALKAQRSIFGKLPEEYGQSNLPDYNQTVFIPKMEKYLEVTGGSAEFFMGAFSNENEGICNALTFLEHHFDSRGKSAVFYEVLEAFEKWDGTLESLNVLPPPEFIAVFKCKTMRAVFETFISLCAATQANVAVRSALDIKVDQRSRKQQLALISQESDLVPLLSEMPGTVSREQLKELFNIFASLPPNTYIEIGSGRHCTGSKIVENLQFGYYDPDFSDRVRRLFSGESMGDLVANTKYIKLSQENSDGTFPASFMAYRFRWQERADFPNYFSADALPQSVEESQAFLAQSPCGFNHVHIAILTHSKDNLRQLMQDGFCDPLLPTQFSPPITPLELLYLTEDHEMLEIFMSSSSLHLRNPSVLVKAYEAGHLDFVHSVLSHPGTTHVEALFKEACHMRDLALIQNIFDLSKIDKAEMFKFVRDSLVSISPESKTVVDCLIKNYKNFVDADGKDFSKLFFSDENIALMRIAGPNSMFLQLGMSFLEKLPKKLDLASGHFYLSVLDKLGEPYCSKYCEAIGSRIEDISGLHHNAYTSLEYFVAYNNPIITATVLSHMNVSAINHVYSDDLKTALHCALDAKHEAPTDKMAQRTIIGLLLLHGADIDIADKRGITCRQLLEGHADEFIRALGILKTARFQDPSNISKTSNNTLNEEALLATAHHKSDLQKLKKEDDITPPTSPTISKRR